MDLWNLTISTASRFPLCPHPGARLEAVRAATRIAADALLLFGLGDDHGHFVVEATRERAAQLAAHLQAALHALGAPRLAPTHFQPVVDRKHLTTLVGYASTQAEHHGFGLLPAADVGSCFADLVGARALPGFDPTRIRALLPRLTDAEVWGVAGLPVLVPVDDATLVALPVLELVAAAAFAAGVPDLHAKAPDVMAARAVAVALLHGSGRSAPETAAALAMDPRTERRLRPRAAPDAVLRARRALAIRAALRGRAGRS